MAYKLEYTAGDGLRHISVAMKAREAFSFMRQWQEKQAARDFVVKNAGAGHMIAYTVDGMPVAECLLVEP